MRLPIPGPNDLLKAAGKSYDAVEQAIALVPRAVALLTQAEQLIARVDSMVGEIEKTQLRARDVVIRTEAVVEEAERTALHTDLVVRRAEATVTGAETVVVRAQLITDEIGPMLDRFTPALTKLEPIVTRIADTTNEREVDAVITLVDHLPGIVDKVERDILPILDTLGTVAPDVRELLDVTREFNEILSSLPGMGRIRKRIEERQEEEDTHLAGEQVSTAPERIRD
ncbi:hypothetical protein JL107_11970 [Nakamurella flavida]|uniref:Ribulose 1,5-bisphosphate carboxylase large subunit n=1 Tax=Nakamurella flavida TaxID=363630 RepID=A0A939C3L3_9ACTN|nr:hypothetical protein [Nakamurella flavida]MBM9477166.1 hypothetical protein [Nakamurella flavida]MDP9780115.1 hypothetical protein [Nakamurella flavida]